MSKLAINLSFAFSLSTFSFISVAAENLNICMIELKPWAFLAENQSPSASVIGVMPDMLSVFEQRTGRTVNKKLLPYARVEFELKHGSCDVALMAWSDHRSIYAIKGTSFMPLEFGIVAAKGIPLAKYEDLANLRISVTRGLSISPEFDEDTKLNKQIDKDNATGIRKLGVNRVDAVGGSLITLQYLIDEIGANELFGKRLVLRKNDFAAAYSKNSPHIKNYQKIDSDFKSMKADGTIAKIVSSWFGARK